MSRFNENARGEHGGQMMMMLGLLAVCCFFLISSSVATFFYKDTLFSDSGAGEETDDAAVDDEAASEETTAPVTTDLDGAKLLTVGGISMRVASKACSKQNKVGFSESKNDKWLWNLRKAGDYEGVPYYTIESFYKNFAGACQARFLTAPTGCKTAPFLSKAEFGPRQYWILYGDSTKGYQLRSLACAQGRYPRSYLMQGAQKKKKLPIFSGRSGSTFRIENQNTA